MPLQQTSGAASYDAFGGGAPVAAKYIEDFFQTWLRTGTGSSTTVTTGLNASINKSLVWTKSRSAATNHKLTDTARGVTKALSSNTTGAEVTDSQGLTAFSSTGYTIGTNTDYNNSGATYVDWQWVATPKFFDVVTYTGAGSVDYAHALGSVPGFALYKATNGTSNWNCVCRKSDGTYELLQLNTTASTFATYANAAAAGLTSTTFNPSPAGSATPSTQFVAYLFAHDAGGFGLTGTDNVISCGSYTGNGSATGPVVDLGYEPQWVMVKRVDSTSGADWYIFDNMRGMSFSSANVLRANDSSAESTTAAGAGIIPTATGFQPITTAAGINASGGSYIYLAIRRGPMKVPTDGTKVFALQAPSNTNIYTSNFPVDLLIRGRTDGSADNAQVWSRLTGRSPFLLTSATNAENFSAIDLDSNTRIVGGASDSNNIYRMPWMFRRAPGFFDEVCYTGTGVAGRTVTHNLTVAPELIITKNRSNGARGWAVLNPNGRVSFLNQNGQEESAAITPFFFGNNTITVAPTATNFTVGTDANTSAENYVAYLFASCPGVSKVFNYTGNGSSQTINCGFTGGARFVMIKRTDSTGDWYVWDTARGIVANNDPHLSLNSTAAEVTTNDTIDTDSTGFVVNQVSATNVNVNGASYIGLAIA